jgi:hypothetical protein
MYAKFNKKAMGVLDRVRVGYVDELHNYPVLFMSETNPTAKTRFRERFYHLIALLEYTLDTKCVQKIFRWVYRFRCRC